MARMHCSPPDPDDPMYIAYAQFLDQMNAHIHVWMTTEGLSDYQRKQAIASALLAEAANFFRNYWGVMKEDFLQMAEEEYDLRGDENATVPVYNH